VALLALNQCKALSVGQSRPSLIPHSAGCLGAGTPRRHLAPCPSCPPRLLERGRQGEDCHERQLAAGPGSGPVHGHQEGAGRQGGLSYELCSVASTCRSVRGPMLRDRIVLPSAVPSVAATPQRPKGPPAFLSRRVLLSCAPALLPLKALLRLWKSPTSPALRPPFRSFGCAGAHPGGGPGRDYHGRGGAAVGGIGRAGRGWRGSRGGGRVWKGRD
jgi:hypothetical protein